MKFLSCEQDGDKLRGQVLVEWRELLNKSEGGFAKKLARTVVGHDGLVDVTVKPTEVNFNGGMLFHVVGTLGELELPTYPDLDVSRCETELRAAFSFAEGGGLCRLPESSKAMGLADALEYLDGYAEDRATCQLFNDFAPHSFGFQLTWASGKPWLSGGLIFHGGTGEELSAPPDPSIGWSVHT